MNDQPISRRALLQRMLRSRFVQVLTAFASLAICAGLAMALWHGRDLIAGVLFVLLILFGINLAWELLPFSAATRARWEHARQLAERYPSCRFRVMLWIGLGQAAPVAWRSYMRGSFDPWEFVVSGFLICAGMISSAVWHHRRHKERI
ncbi:MAG: hypothetical protein V4710_16435 [Verrucomicrobiota bacterium]